MNRAPDPRDRDAWHRWQISFDTEYDREMRRGHMRTALRAVATGMLMLSGISGLTILVAQVFGL